MHLITNLEQLIEDKQYFIGNNRTNVRFKGKFISKDPIQQRGPYQRFPADDEDDEEYEYTFSGNIIRHHEGQEVLTPRPDYKIKQSQVNSGQVVVYLSEEDDITNNVWLRNNLPKVGNTDLARYTKDFFGGRKRMKSKARRYKKSIGKSNRRSKTRKTRK